MIRSVILLGILLSTSALFAQRGSPGMRQADQADAQYEKSIPPPTNPRVTVDPLKIRQDADELATLAQSIPPDVEQTMKGVLPKDLNDKLKRIEKLAKKLRSQISQ